jgi:protein-disulfide isomerase-like protein with CxxC motif
MIFIYNTTESESALLPEGGTITQHEQINNWQEAHGFTIEQFNIDVNADARVTAERFEITEFPALLITDGETCTVLAKGLDAILLLNQDGLAQVQTALNP